MQSIRLALQAILCESGVSETPALDAQLLLGAALRKTRLQLLTIENRRLTFQECYLLKDALRRRLSGESVGRILGQREFWSLSFQLNSATLEPRPDTETLVEAALSAFRTRASTPEWVLDIGTGSGALAVALATEWPKAHFLATDISLEALEMARLNAKTHNVTARLSWLCSDYVSALNLTERGRKFDCIVSNPPYIACAEFPKLPLSVRRFDPSKALDGGEDGLAAYRVLLPKLPSLLNQGGYVFLEVGQGQADAVEALCQSAGMQGIQSHFDLAGVARVVEARKIRGPTGCSLSITNTAENTARYRSLGPLL